MKIAVCLDDKNGMMFAGRRQSMDGYLRRAFLALAGTDKVWMNQYTAGQFADVQDRLLVDEDFLLKAEAEDWCFVEDQDLLPVMERITEIVIYRWNRVYPSDRKFPMALFANRWQLVSQRDFAGNSHERITEEVYRL